MIVLHLDDVQRDDNSWWISKHKQHLPCLARIIPTHKRKAVIKSNY